MNSCITLMICIFIVFDKLIYVCIAVVLCDLGQDVETANDIYKIEPRHEKTNVLVSDQVRHKPGCTATEDG